MGEILNYSLEFILAARIGLQAFLLWLVADLYQATKRRHVVYAMIVYIVVLVEWILDALVYFMVLSRSDIVVLFQDGIIPFLISLCLLALALSSKKRIDI